jgi:hypothetical protein
MTEGGKHLPGVGECQLRYHNHGSNLSACVTKGMRMICKSSRDFILCQSRAGFTSSPPGWHQTLSDPVWSCCFCSFATRNDECKSQLVSVLWLVFGTPHTHICELSDPCQSLRRARWCPTNLYNQQQGGEIYRYRNVEYVFSQVKRGRLPFQLITQRSRTELRVKAIHVIK